MAEFLLAVGAYCFGALMGWIVRGNHDRRHPDGGTDD